MWGLKRLLKARLCGDIEQKLAAALAQLAAALAQLEEARRQQQDLLEQLRATESAVASRDAEVHRTVGWLREAEARAASCDALRQDAERIAAARLEQLTKLEKNLDRLSLLEKLLASSGAAASLDQPDTPLEAFLHEHGLVELAATLKWRRFEQEKAVRSRFARTGDTAEDANAG